MPLDRTIHELEARLPDLRHLLAEGEIILAMSDSAALLADELESLLGRADTVARRLRHLLLGGDLSGVLEQEREAVVPPLPLPEVSDAPSGVTDAEVSTPAEAWSDENLAQTLELLPEEPSPEQVRGRQKLEEIRGQFNLSETSALTGQVKAEQELNKLETKLGVSDTDEPERREYIGQLEMLARQLGSDPEQISSLWRELGLDRPDDDEEDTPGGTALGAQRTPRTPQSPGAERTFDAAQEPPRSP